jgi:hypothetical protein
MSDNYSLVEMMSEDEDIFQSLENAKAETKKSKKELSSNAADFNKKYEDEIKESTRKRQLMLESAGIEDGTSASEEMFRDNETFMPTVQTPVLNFIHYLGKECDEMEDKMEVLREQYEQKFGDALKDIENATVDKSTLNDLDVDGLDDLFESIGEVEDTFDTGDTVPHMEKYIYKNMDAGTFGKLKKLKALSMSENEQEAHAAWTKCMELCEKFDLNFDSIPCKVTD